MVPQEVHRETLRSAPTLWMPVGCRHASGGGAGNPWGLSR